VGKQVRLESLTPNVRGEYDGVVTKLVIIK